MEISGAWNYKTESLCHDIGIRIETYGSSNLGVFLGSLKYVSGNTCGYLINKRNFVSLWAFFQAAQDRKKVFFDN